MKIAFDNSYAHLPERFYARVSPTPVAQPRLVKLNRGLATELGLDADALDGPEGAAIFAGNAAPEGAEPIAQAYAGHQFGSFVPQLGDGRAILLGEVIDRQGVRRDLQLKGAGPTPFSRRGDGRAAVGPVLREYLVSEAMAAMGVPTTRALAAATTGEPVYRERPLPGAVVTRECTTLDVNYSPCQYRSRRPGRLRSKAGVRQLDDGKDRAHGEVRAGQPAAPVYDAYDARINAERMTAPEQPKPHWRSFVSAEKA
jgi:hypothetical protein